MAFGYLLNVIAGFILLAVICFNFYIPPWFFKGLQRMWDKAVVMFSDFKTVVRAETKE